MQLKQLNLTLAGILGLVLTPQIVFAHSLETNFRLQSNALELQSVLSNGETLKDAKVVIYAPNDRENPWFEGKTDANGEFEFNPDPAIAGNWSVEIGEDDHWDRLIIPVNQQGIEMNEISEVPETPAHEHYSIASINNQFMITAIALGVGIGFSALTRKLK